MADTLDIPIERTFQLIDDLVRVLEQVEFVQVHNEIACPWCKGPRASSRHYADCPRQEALTNAYNVLPLARILDREGK